MSIGLDTTFGKLVRQVRKEPEWGANRMQSLQSENTRLREALEIYANPNHWKVGEWNLDEGPEYAREALKGGREGNDAT